jgi:hypothetical protein
VETLIQFASRARNVGSGPWPTRVEVNAGSTDGRYERRFGDRVVGVQAQGPDEVIAAFGRLHLR